jgi:formate hydrogenlyase subunit 4
MYEIIFFLLIPFIAMLYEGLYRKINARLQNRIGPPIIQPFFDIVKLFSKKKLKTQNDPFFRVSPLLYFLATYSLFLFIPFSLIKFEYDFLLLLYLTILSSAFYILCGLSSDNPFGIVGSMREMILMIVYEITLVVSVVNFILKSNILSLANLNSSFLFLSLPLSSLGLFLVYLVELHVTPFDTTEAQTEIMAGSKTEYSGKNLAFMELATYMKRLFFIFFIPLVLFGRDLIIILPLSVAFLFLYTFLQATTSRYRVDQALNFYIVVLFLVLLEFVLVVRGLL